MPRKEALPIEKLVDKNFPEVGYRSKTGIGIECIDLQEFYCRAVNIKPSPFQPIRIHFHCFLVPTYVGVHMVDFKKVNFDSNTIVYIGPGQVHAWERTNLATGTLILMSDDWFDKLKIFTQKDQSWYWRHVNTLGYSQPNLIRSLTDILKKESSMLIPSHSLMLLAAHWLSFLSSDSSDAHSVRDIERLSRLQVLVEKHIKENRTVSFYANQIGLTSDALNNFIKRMRGVTAKNWINQALILEAKRILVTENTSISELALLLGFSEATHFIRFFRNYVGKTPFEFRRLYLNSGF